MKILILNQILYTHADGMIPKVKSIKDTMIYQMCLGFCKLGHDVTLAAASEYKPTENEKYDFDVEWFESDYTKLFPATLLPYSKALRQYLKENRHQFDLIISKEVFSFSSLIAAKICPDRTILWVEQANHQRKFHQIPSKIWFNVVAKLYCTKLKAIVPCSERAKQFLKQYLPNTIDEIVEHGIDISKFAPAKAKKRQVIVSSQLIKRKNIESIIRIFATLHAEAEYKDVVLLIAGRGPEEDFLKSVASEEKLGESVKFLGFLSQTDLGRYVSESLALLVNTRADMNMVSVPESVCSATPIIMNEVPLNSWYVKKFKLGIVKNGWNKEDLVQVIMHNDTYVENCLNYRQRLSIESSAQRLTDVFLSVK